MIHPVSNASLTQSVAPSTGTSAQKPAPSKPQSAPGGDSVQLSQATQAAVAALKEIQETAAQTANEAGHGDHQAQRLLAKETAAKSVTK